MKITKQQLVDLYQVANGLDKTKGVQFAYAIAKTLTLIDGEFQALRKAGEPKEAWIEFDQKRVELGKTYAQKDEHGEPILIDGTKYQINDVAGYKKDLEDLQEEYKEAIEAQEQHEKELSSLLEQEIEIELPQIELEHIPDDINIKEMYQLLPLIKE